MPVLHLLAGSDGAGKSTYVDRVLAPATGLTAMSRGDSFITETVFSHPSKVALVADAAALGYLVHLHVIMVPVELTVQRVSERVRRGGHQVPEAKIRERYERLWTHIAAAIELADAADVFDNSNARQPFRLCASYSNGAMVGLPEWPRWAPSAFTAIHDTGEEGDPVV